MNDDAVWFVAQIHTLFPNTMALHIDTRYDFFTEAKPERGVTELTVFYREPNQEKIRIDAEIDDETLVKVPQERIRAQHVRIVQWGSAVAAMEVRG